MSGDLSEHFNRAVDNPRTLAAIFALVVIVGVAFVVVGGGPFAPTQDAAADQACQEQFGEEYTYKGWISGNPPVLACDGPNGEEAFMDMPQHVAEDLDLRAEYYDNDSNE